MNGYELQSLQNTNMEQSVSSLSILVILMIFGGLFSINKKKNYKLFYTRLNPDFITHGFINFQKIDFKIPKAETNLWNQDRLQTRFAQRIPRPQKTKG